ncbi:metallophosphoesterase [Dysosmobacter sp.]|uniref:metallophosphoesterase n=1 Tax=Dysosmobacter sp. TaxID=2591382 RepID=UPI002A8E3B66|nr:metallophosphoesterase [Dysosmobacter sp.]MDY3281463.1 metallophosphoesterase [Dysosmobacter sp.]
MAKYGGRLRWLGAAALLALALWTANGFLSSRYALTAERWEVPLPRLTAPVRAAVLSDLHDTEFGEGGRTLAERVAAEEPDLIFLLGDMLNAASPDSRRLTALVTRLSEIAPVYFAWGNHELDYLAAGTSPLQPELEAAGATVLELDYADITVNGAALRLGGLYEYAFAMDDYNTCDPARMDPAVYGFLTKFQATDRCRVLLSHRPDTMIFGEAAATWGVELAVSGHLHGGQAVLPVLGGVYGGDQGLFPAYVHGLYQKEQVRLAITSGLGSEPGRPRFRNPPEIMILDLLPQSGQTEGGTGLGAS